jgi:hypothetical protein
MAPTPSEPQGRRCEMRTNRAGQAERAGAAANVFGNGDGNAGPGAPHRELQGQMNVRRRPAGLRTARTGTDRIARMWRADGRPRLVA